MIEEWNTIQIAPLPTGWINVFKQSDGSEEASPCPAMLLESNSANPSETRMVFADVDRDGIIYPANDLANYVRTRFGQP